MRRAWKEFILIGVLSMSLTACQSMPFEPPAGPLASTAMPQGMPQKDPPPGFISFCLRFVDQCASTAREASTITLDSQKWLALAKINSDVNEAIWPKDDIRHFGIAEYWTIPTDGYGNCHDYAVTKRKELIDVGFPKPSLRIAIVVTPQQERHAVLTVATDKGDYVLDNLTPEILPWDKTGYQWISRQDDKNDWGWVAFNETPTQMAAVTTTSQISAK